MKTLLQTLVLTCSVAPLAVALAQNVEGEKWKITNSMQMAGMSLPAMNSEICKQPGDDSVPVKTEKNCEVYDVNRTGNVQSFKMRCTGKDAMEGSAKFTYLGPDHYQGQMIVNAQGETMTMNYEGKKIGKCDGGEINIQAKKMIAEGEKQKAQSEKLMAEQCHKMAAEAAPGVMGTQCKDPQDIKTFCTNVRTHDKFKQFAEIEKASGDSNAPGSKALSDAAKLCGFTVDAERTQLCNSAESAGKLSFLSSQCPTQAAALAQAQCAGRKYTAINEKYRDFCASYASNQEEQPTGKAKGLFNKSKKALGGLFNNN